MQQEDRRKRLPEIKAEAAGNWPYIFADLAPELGPAMEANGEHVACPVHGGRDGFRLFEDYAHTGGGVCNTCHKKGDTPANGFAMLVWVKSRSQAGYDFRDALREVASWLRGEAVNPTIAHRPPPPPPTPKFNPEKARASIEWIRSRARDLKGTPAELYLRKRGIWPENQPRSLAFHPSLRYYHGKPPNTKLLGEWPAMVAKVTNAQDEVLAIHRTFITAEGDKAPVPDAKKLTSAVSALGGSAIRLFQHSDVLGVGEGIETMLAVRAISRMPVWSAVSAPLLELLEIPDEVRHVVIWGDLDVSGRGVEAARTLEKRMLESGRTVEVHIPQGPIPADAKGIDWLDVLLNQGLEGFPEAWRRWRPAA